MFEYNGEAIFDLFFLIANNPDPSVGGPSLGNKLRDCCFELNVLADTIRSSEFVNDKSSALFRFNHVVTGAVLKLYKDNVDVETLDNGAFGTFFDYGFYENDLNEKYIGYLIEWRFVLLAHGVGKYKIVCEATPAVGAEFKVNGVEYCLSNYSDVKADGTVRIEYFLNRNIGSSANDKIVQQFGDLNWYNQIRLNGFFGFPSSTYESEFIQYENGQRLYVKDRQEPEFILKLKSLPATLHDLIRTDVMQSDEILITDYNSKNAQKFVKKSVYKVSDYSPDWSMMQSKLASVEIKMRQTFNNLQKRRC